MMQLVQQVAAQVQGMQMEQKMELLRLVRCRP
jgi:hypothetical protein